MGGAAGGYSEAASGRAGCAESRDAAGSLVLRRMDCREHKRGLVRAKKHDTKSRPRRPAPAGLFLNEN